MIPVEEAKKIIHQNTYTLPPVRKPLQHAAGMVLASDVFAVTDIPAFNQSSMDGYAISYSGWQLHKSLKIEGEIPAGTNEEITFSPERAVRIFTGAALPSGANTVVMQEKVKTENGKLIIQDEQLQAGENVRPKGSEIRAGELALPKESFLSPAAIGFLAGVGISELSVYPKPSITIIVTGKELQQPGQPLQYGQVYESNSFTLQAVLRQLQFDSVNVVWADDDLDILTNILQNALQKSDLVLLTGGISVGDYDYVLEAATRCGVLKLFHRVKQRPGKPLFFGKKENKWVFGLPGNPSSVLTCFYEYVIPAMEKLCGRNHSIKTLSVPLANAYFKKKGLTHFLKGYYDGNKVKALAAQESYRLRSFALANCLIQLNEDGETYHEGNIVEVHLFPLI